MAGIRRQEIDIAYELVLSKYQLTFLALYVEVIYVKYVVLIRNCNYTYARVTSSLPRECLRQHLRTVCRKDKMQMASGRRDCHRFCLFDTLTLL